MLFKRISRSDPERIFVVAKNSYGTASLTNGQCVIWDFTTDANGVSVTKPRARTTSEGFAVAGIVSETIAADAYGLVQVYGYHSAVRVRSCTSAYAIAAGQPLVQSLAASFALEPYSTSTGTANILRVYPCAFALATYSSWTTTTMAAFIKAMG